MCQDLKHVPMSLHNRIWLPHPRPQESDRLNETPNRPHCNILNPRIGEKSPYREPISVPFCFQDGCPRPMSVAWKPFCFTTQGSESRRCQRSEHNRVISGGCPFLLRVCFSPGLSGHYNCYLHYTSGTASFGAFLCEFQTSLL